MEKVTLVTGLWDIGRGQLSDGWSRSFSYYQSCFERLLPVDSPLIVFGDESLRSYVMSRRRSENTLFIERGIEWFKNEFYDDIQKIRTDESWLSQAGWLRESTQARLSLYNPLVMSKVFLLNDARILDPFDSTHLFWIDAGLANTVSPDYFTNKKVQNNVPALIQDFCFICFPYQAQNEIHGFAKDKMNDLSGSEVSFVARGGFFGGKKSFIQELNGLYYQLLSETLKAGYMGTEESLFTILCYRYPQTITRFFVEPNGLLWPFFEGMTKP